MMRTFRHNFTIVGWLQRIEQADGNRHHAAMAEDAFEVRHAGLSAVPADYIGMLAIIDGHGTHLHVQRGRGDSFQQGRSEFEQVPTAAGRSFRKHGQRLLMLQGFADPLDLDQ